jgi:hypothetical protein
MRRMLSRLSERMDSTLRRYQFRNGGGVWREAFWNILHRQPVRSGLLPWRVHRIFNMWGPNGWMGNSRFNVNKPYNPGAPGTLQSIAAAARRKFSR